MFSATEIDNDLKAVDVAVREYYELDTPILTPDERPKEAPIMPEVEPEREVKVEPIPEPEEPRRRRQRKER